MGQARIMGGMASCPPPKYATVRGADLSFLRKLIRDEDTFNESFSVTHVSIRRGYTLRPLTTAKTRRLEQQFAWRIVEVLNERP